MTIRPDRHPTERRLAGATRRGVFLAVALLLAGASAVALSGAADTVSSLQRRLEEIIEGTGWRSADWSVLAVSLDTGDTLYAHRPGEALAPASNMKLATTAAALHHLGKDFRYQTFVLADGPVAGGVLEGDLVLYGTGDPGISDRFFASRTAVFESLADRLVERGIREVRGNVVGDGSYFVGPLLGEGWDPRDLNDWFAASASALSYNENVVTLRVEPGSSDGARPVLHTLPAGAGIPVVMTASTGRGRLTIEREHPTDPVSIDGSIARGGREVWRQITVGDPARFAAQVFLNVLEEKGIRVSGGLATVEDAAASTVTARRLWAPGHGEAPEILARHESPPLRDYIEVINKESHNLLAELTLKTMGRVVSGDGSYAGGARLVEGFLASEAGVDTSRVVVVDGSGLSSGNRISSGAFVRLMAYMAASDRWEPFWSSLPEAGNPRELRRMYRTQAAGNLRAKTGTIEHVSALSGMVRSANGERIAFSIIGNAVPSTWGAKRVEDRIGVQLASFERPFEARAVDFAAASGGTDGPGATGDSATAVASAAAPPDQADATPDTAAAPPVAASPTTHLVEAGENFSVIARRYDVPVDALQEANPDVSPRRLQPGMRLTIPGDASSAAPGDAAPAEPSAHTVRTGENLTVIARRYGVSVEAIVEANPGLRRNSIRAGQTLKIPPRGGA